MYSILSYNGIAFYKTYGNIFISCKYLLDKLVKEYRSWKNIGYSMIPSIEIRLARKSYKVLVAVSLNSWTVGYFHFLLYTYLNSLNFL